MWTAVVQLEQLMKTCMHKFKSFLKFTDVDFATRKVSSKNSCAFWHLSKTKMYHYRSHELQPEHPFQASPWSWTVGTEEWRSCLRGIFLMTIETIWNFPGGYWNYGMALIVDHLTSRNFPDDYWNNWMALIFYHSTSRNFPDEPDTTHYCLSPSISSIFSPSFSPSMYRCCRISL